jgi:hyaluronate lyase
MYLIPTLVFLEDDLTRDQIKHYLKPYDYLIPFPVGSGGNFVDFTISVFIAGALERDAYKIAQAKYLAKPLFEYITIDKMGVGADGGIFTDGSFIQHSDTPYTGGYGEIMVTTLPMLVNVVNGTPFAFEDEQIRTMFDWVFDVYRPKMYEGKLMGGHIGRGIGTDEPYKFNNLIRGMIYMLPFCPENLKAEFTSLVRTFMHQAGQSYYDSVPIIFSTVAQQLYDDQSVPLINDYFITRVFGNECRISHHGPEYGISIALSNKRICKYSGKSRSRF